jgi:hypothetical protein
MKQRAFTILELLVGLVVSTIVLLAILQIFQDTMVTQRRQRVRAELARQGAFLGNMLHRELRVIGLGKPLGTSVIGAQPPPVSISFAGNSALGFVADLPRPDATFSTFGFLEDRPAGFRRLMFHTDQNGACASDGGACDIETTSTLYRGDAATCATSAGDRTCPWGNKRLRGNEIFQVVAGNGTWTNLQADGGAITMQPTTAPDGGTVNGLVVDAAEDPSRALGWPATWTNFARGDPPVDIRGQGFVTTLDRVFYRFCGEDCLGGSGADRVLERRQCWGPVIPNHPAWPTTADNTNEAALLGGAFDPAALPGGECTPWEIVARDVESVTFSYFRERTANPGNADNVANNSTDSTFGLSAAARQRSAQPRVGTQLGRADIRQIRYAIVLRRNVDGFPIRHDVVGGVRLRN